MSQQSYSSLFSTLEETLHHFIQAVHNQLLSHMATDEWTVKDVLCHIVFWQTYYAQNYAALAKHEQPVVFTSKGGSVRNQKGVNSLKNKSQGELFTMLELAERSLRESIMVKKVPRMQYTTRKSYTTEEFLDEIIRHIKGHTQQVIRAKN